MELLRVLLSGVSAQRPSHALFVGGEALPLEARMGGIFLGFLWAVVLVALLGRLRARRMPAGGATLACLGLIATMAVDGLNATLFDAGLPHAYAPNTVLRLLTGLAGGYGLALLALPVTASVVWVRSLDEAPLDDAVEVGAGLAVLLMVGAVLLADVPLLLWPVALAQAGGVLVSFSVANVYVLALAEQGRASLAGVTSDSGMRGSPLAAFGLALLEVAALGALRTWMASLGATWGV